MNVLKDTSGDASHRESVEEQKQFLSTIEGAFNVDTLRKCLS